MSQWILSLRWVCRSATDMVPIGRVFTHADVVYETLPGALAICGDSQYSSPPTAAEC